MGIYTYIYGPSDTLSVGFCLRYPFPIPQPTQEHGERPQGAPFAVIQTLLAPCSILFYIVFFRKALSEVTHSCRRKSSGVLTIFPVLNFVASLAPILSYIILYSD